jgi:uncharacterized membrane protein YkgB
MMVGIMSARASENSAGLLRTPFVLNSPFISNLFELTRWNQVTQLSEATLDTILQATEALKAVQMHPNDTFYT